MPTIINPSTVGVRLPTTFIGVDPGANGGLAMVCSDRSAIALKTPSTRREVFDWFRGFDGMNVIVIMEKVTGYVGGYNRESKEEGDRTNPGAHMFNFGKSVERVMMAIECNNLSYEEIIPHSWQKALGIIRPPNTDGPAWKRVLKAKAIELFPDLKVTLATCDALLLAEYGRRKYGDNK